MRDHAAVIIWKEFSVGLLLMIVAWYGTGRMWGEVFHQFLDDNGDWPDNRVSGILWDLLLLTTPLLPIGYVISRMFLFRWMTSAFAAQVGSILVGISIWHGVHCWFFLDHTIARYEKLLIEDLDHRARLELKWHRKGIRQ